LWDGAKLSKDIDYQIAWDEFVDCLTGTDIFNCGPAYRAKLDAADAKFNQATAEIALNKQNAIAMELSKLLNELNSCCVGGGLIVTPGAGSFGNPYCSVDPAVPPPPYCPNSQPINQICERSVIAKYKLNVEQVYNKACLDYDAAVDKFQMAIDKAYRAYIDAFEAGIPEAGNALQLAIHAAWLTLQIDIANVETTVASLVAVLKQGFYERIKNCCNQ
jgi:hypothetical protein